MMRKNALILVVVVYCVSTLVSCASLFTPELRYALGDVQIHQVQYYVNETIILTREVPKGEKPVTASGTVLFSDGKYIEKIVIPKGTPGELIKYGPLTFDDGTTAECLGICFEASENDINEILYFKPGRPGASWKDGYYLVYTDGETGKVRYGNQMYNVTCFGNTWPYLLGVADSKYGKDRIFHKAIGRRVQWYEK
jgi:hypothetical protein